jgi:type IV secretion system T-DNA border endonuclease VirD2
VHKLIFSMPPGTPPDKVLLAVKNFAREEWGAKHRYALVLHTDEPHPHVHVVVKAMSEEGQRLNIRKDTLRRWRQGFARHLRDLGVPANATERAARGVSKKAKLDGIYRAAARGDSTHYRQRAEAVARSLRQGAFAPEAGKETLMAIRREVIRGWGGLRDQLLEEGHTGLARAVDEFTTQMPPPLTDNERIKSALLSAAEKARARKIPQPGREPEQKEAKRDPEASPSPPERER